MFPSEFCFALFSSLIPTQIDNQAGASWPVPACVGYGRFHGLARYRAIAGGWARDQLRFILLQSEQPARQPGEPDAVLAARHRLAVCVSLAGPVAGSPADGRRPNEMRASVFRDR